VTGGGSSTSDGRLATPLPFGTPAWTFGASAAPWWSLDGLVGAAPPVRFVGQKTMSLIRRGAMPP